MRNKSSTQNLETHAKFFKLSDGCNITGLNTIATALSGISKVPAYPILLRLVATIIQYNPAQEIIITSSLGGEYMENPGNFINLAAPIYNILPQSEVGIIA